MSNLTIPRLPICVDRYLPGERFDPASRPSPAEMRSASPQELALDKYKLWQPAQVLRIRFLDGEPGIRKIVENLARQWLECANLEFEFGNFPDAEIRVTFQAFWGDGYWSYVGTDAYKVSDPEPTVQFCGLAKDSDPLELQRVVVHEFGHAIGCVHEQARSDSPIPWNLPVVYNYYWEHYNWDKAMVDANILLRYGPSQLSASTYYDPKSIMQYPVPKELTTGGFEIGWNRELSEMDKSFVAKIYPK